MSLRVSRADALGRGVVRVELVGKVAGVTIGVIAIVNHPEPEVGLPRPWAFPIVAVDPQGRMQRLVPEDRSELDALLTDAYYNVTEALDA
jgi:hypothetical protein